MSFTLHASPKPPAVERRRLCPHQTKCSARCSRDLEHFSGRRRFGVASFRGLLRQPWQEPHRIVKPPAVRTPRLGAPSISPNAPRCGSATPRPSPLARARADRRAARSLRSASAGFGCARASARCAGHAGLKRVPALCACSQGATGAYLHPNPRPDPRCEDASGAGRACRGAVAGTRASARRLGTALTSPARAPQESGAEAASLPVHVATLTRV